MAWDFPVNLARGRADLDLRSGVRLPRRVATALIPTNPSKGQRMAAKKKGKKAGKKKAGKKKAKR